MLPPEFPANPLTTLIPRNGRNVISEDEKSANQLTYITRTTLQTNISRLGARRSTAQVCRPLPANINRYSVCFLFFPHGGAL